MAGSKIRGEGARVIRGQRDAPSGGHIVVIALYALLVGLSGVLTVPPLDRDESRFVQATTQMIETGDFVRIKFQDDERNKKPIGIYWLQAASVVSFADIEDRPLWAFRLPSLLGGMLAALFTYLAGCALFGRGAAFLGAVLLSAAPVVAGEASIAKTDAVLLAAIAGQQAALAWLLTARGRPLRPAILFWTAMGIGVLVKGPIAVMVGLATLAGLAFWALVTARPMRDLARVRPIMGVVIVAAIVTPWLVAILHLTDGRFLAEALGTDALGKVSVGQENHGGPFGYHLALLTLMFWPAILFLPAALKASFGGWRRGRIAFCLAWLVPMWLLFEVSATKLPHYPMPLYPALALLIGALLTGPAVEQHRYWRWVGVALYGLGGIFCAVLLVYLAGDYSTSGIDEWHWIGAALVLIGTGVTARLAMTKRSTAALAAAVLTSGSFAWILFEGVLPTLDRLALTPRLAAMLDQHEAHPLEDNAGPVGLVGYHEPSAVFTLGTGTRLLDGEAAAAWLSSGEGGAVVVEDRDVGTFLNALPPGFVVVALASIEGFNYSNNKDIRLTLYRGKSPA